MIELQHDEMYAREDAYQPTFNANTDKIFP